MLNNLTAGGDVEKYVRCQMEGLLARANVEQSDSRKRRRKKMSYVRWKACWLEQILNNLTAGGDSSRDVRCQMEGLLARAKPLGYFTGSWIGAHTSSITTSRLSSSSTTSSLWVTSGMSNLPLDPERCLLAERDLVRSPAHFILRSCMLDLVMVRSCMLEDFLLSDKSELFPLNPVRGSSTFSSSTSLISMNVTGCVLNLPLLSCFFFTVLLYMCGLHSRSPLRNPCCATMGLRLCLDRGSG